MWPAMPTATGCPRDSACSIRARVASTPRSNRVRPSSSVPMESETSSTTTSASRPGPAVLSLASGSVGASQPGSDSLGTLGRSNTRATRKMHEQRVSSSRNSRRRRGHFRSLADATRNRAAGNQTARPATRAWRWATTTAPTAMTPSATQPAEIPVMANVACTGVLYNASGGLGTPQSRRNRTDNVTDR